MARDVKTQLRITAWPGAPLPLPANPDEGTVFELVDEVLVPKEWRLWKDPMQRDDELRRPNSQPSGETYLRLSELDLDDPLAILGFVNDYGLLAGAFAYDSLQKSFAKEVFEGQLDLWEERNRQVRALRKLAVAESPRLAKADKVVSETLDDILSGHVGGVPPQTETLNEFRFAARCIHDVFTAWRMVQDGRAPTDLLWLSVSKDEQFANVHGPIDLLSELLRVFLRPFTPQIRFDWGLSRGLGPEEVEHLFRPADSMEVRAVRGPEAAPLYSICALELFNHIVEGAVFRICGNVNCQRTFVHQQGRAKKGQQRSTGVMYCSAECARATAQREYRRRRRATESANS